MPGPTSRPALKTKGFFEPAVTGSLEAAHREARSSTKPAFFLGNRLKSRPGVTDAPSMERDPRADTSALRIEASVGTGVGIIVAGVAAVGLFVLTGSWIAALAGVALVGGLLGAWVDVFVRRNLAFVDTLVNAAAQLDEGGSLSLIEAQSMGRFGQVGRAFNALLEALGATAGRVIASMHRVRGTPERISEVLVDIQKSAEAQEEAVEETASLLANINSSIQHVEEKIENLSSAADESSSSILEMGTSVDEVARNAASLHESFESSAAAVQQMSASTRQVAESAAAVRQMAEDSAVSMNEIDRSIQEVSEHVLQASTLTETVSHGAREGTEAVESTIRDIEEIHSLTNDAKQRLGQLVSRIAEVSQIMNVIGEINDETNLLSLNAAIIAAQAGEQGKAFLVVANHVKTLATRTAASTKDIEQLIRGIEAESDAAVASMDAGSAAIEQGVNRSRTAGAALVEIRSSAEEASARVAEIARAAEQQSQNSRHVATTVQETSTEIQQISDAMLEQTKVSERMLETSQKALDMCQHVHRSTDEQRETGQYITSSISSITEMIQKILESISEHRRASESVSEAVFRLLDNAQSSGRRVPELNQMLAELRDSAEEIVGELSRFEEGSKVQTEPEVDDFAPFSVDELDDDDLDDDAIDQPAL